MLAFTVRDAWIMVDAADMNGTAHEIDGENEGKEHICVTRMRANVVVVSKCARECVCLCVCVCVCKSSHRIVEIQLYGHMHVDIQCRDACVMRNTFQ